MNEQVNFPGDEPSKAIKKLADVAELLITPFALRSRARAEAYRIRTITQAEIEAAELKERAQISAELRMIRQQINKEKILRMATAEQLSLPDSPDSEPVDADWLIKFGNLAQDVSTEQVQRMWAKVLAGEISNPGTFSVRFMTMLSAMTHAEANQFLRFSHFVWHSMGGRYSCQPYSEQSDQLLEKQYQIDRRSYVLLTEVALIEANTTSVILLREFPPGPAADFRYGQEYFRVSSNYDNIGLRVRILTTLGRQLLRLCDNVFTGDPEYVRALNKYSPHLAIEKIADPNPEFVVDPQDAVVLNG